MATIPANPPTSFANGIVTIALGITPEHTDQRGVRVRYELRLAQGLAFSPGNGVLPEEIPNTRPVPDATPTRTNDTVIDEYQTLITATVVQRALKLDTNGHGVGSIRITVTDITASGTFTNASVGNGTFAF